jgi:large subunit ribosomal protein L18
MLRLQALRERRKQRVRIAIRKRGGLRPRLSVFRSNKNIYAQVIDDCTGVTLAAASTVEKELKSSLKSGSTREAAIAVGKLLGERAVAKGVGETVFDRGPYIYHGRVKALADAAREAGLNF